MSNPNSFVIDGFVPTVTFAASNEQFKSTICVYNYFSEIFPTLDTAGRVHAWAFDMDGTSVGHLEEPIAHRGQMQIDADVFGKPFFGCVGVSLVPTHPPEPRPKLVGTGYYMQYWSADGKCEHSHEWDAMRFKPHQSVPWICVVRPNLGETRLIVLSSYFGTSASEGESSFSVRLRDKKGKVMDEVKNQHAPIRGCWSRDLLELFPRAAKASSAPISVEVQGKNIMGPFMMVVSNNQDFNIHHFC